MMKWFKKIKVRTESLKETQTKVNLEIKDLESQDKQKLSSKAHLEYKRWKKESQVLKT
jgi:hypothetical protein